MTYDGSEKVPDPVSLLRSSCEAEDKARKAWAFEICKRPVPKKGSLVHLRLMVVL